MPRKCITIKAAIKSSRQKHPIVSTYFYFRGHEREMKDYVPLTTEVKLPIPIPAVITIQHSFPVKSDHKHT